MSFGRAGGGMRRGVGPPERAKDLRGTLRRLLARLRPERIRLVIALLLGVTSVGFLVSGPRILGDATNVLFNGVVAKLPKTGTTKAQAIALHYRAAAEICGDYCGRVAISRPQRSDPPYAHGKTLARAGEMRVLS